MAFAALDSPDTAEDPALIDRAPCLDRRNLVKAGAGAGAFAVFGSLARASDTRTSPTSSATAFAAALAALADEIILLGPESATTLGFDTGKYASLRRRQVNPERCGSRHPPGR